MLLLTQQNRWSRRDSKKLSEKSYKSDNRRSVRKAMQRIIDKAKRIKEEKNKINSIQTETNTIIS